MITLMAGSGVRISAGFISVQLRLLIMGSASALSVSDDLRNFAQQWLMDGRGLPADLNHSTHVDFVDYSIFASHWFDFCPDNWPLK